MKPKHISVRLHEGPESYFWVLDTDEEHVMRMRADILERAEELRGR